GCAIAFGTGWPHLLQNSSSALTAALQLVHLRLAGASVCAEVATAPLLSFFCFCRKSSTWVTPTSPAAIVPNAPAAAVTHDSISFRLAKWPVFLQYRSRFAHLLRANRGLM